MYVCVCIYNNNISIPNINVPLNSHFSKESIQMAEKNKGYSIANHKETRKYKLNHKLQLHIH